MLGRVIVLDGVDGGGKSTLAKAIMEQAKQRGQDSTYVHCTYRPGMHVLIHQTTQMLEALASADQGQVAVIDRLWPSENVYAAVYRAGEGWPTIGRLLDRILLKYAAVYCLALPNPEVHREHFKRLKLGRVEMYDNVEPVREMFQQFAMGNPSHESRATLVDHYIRKGGAVNLEPERFTGYDMHAEKPDECAARVLKLADSFFNMQLALLRDPEFPILGHAGLAKWLLVGEKCNVKEKYASFPKWPFFEDGNSSQYLMETMTEVDLPESQFAYVNAYDVPHEVLSMLTQTHLKPIALGAKAAMRLREAEVPNFVMVNHPQWERRFNRHGHYGDRMSIKLLKAMSL